jgi:Tol biopolymer transport system component/DNA-binding winged helix-turn-helix (wHTH) protein
MAREIKSGTVRFGIYEADLDNRILTKSGFRIRLQDQPFQVLALLVERAGQVVTRQEMQEKLWSGDTFVAFDEGLNTAIKKVRVALSDNAENPRFVETVPKVGYRFIAPVTPVSADTLEPPSLVPAGDAVEAVQIKAPPVVTSPRLPSSPRRTFVLWTTAVSLILVAIYWMRPLAPMPRVRRVRQYTHLGSLYVNQNLVSDGTRIYFTVDENGGRQLAYVSVDGGEINKVKMAFPRVDVHDISPSGTELLGTFPDQSPPRQLWRLPLNGTSPRQVDGLKISDSFWMPDGRIGYAYDTDLFLLTGENGDSRRLAHFEQAPFSVRWRPDSGLARFMLVGENQNTLWQIKADGTGLRPVLPDWKTSIRCWPGRWTNDGRYYYFVAADGPVRNVWVLRDQADVFHRTNQEPLQLTSGPINFFQPVPGRDGKTIFVIGEQRGGQLMRYDTKSRTFSPYLPDFSADHVSFSADGNWMAYVQYPEGVLYRSRTDGSEKMQLTYSPMRTYQPRWSPDGRWISFFATPNTGKLYDGYIVSRDGGELRVLGHRSASQDSHLCWTPESKAEYAVTDDQPGAGTTIYTQDLQTGATTQRTLTLGFDMTECSPDGKFISGYDPENHELMVYDVAQKQARRVGGYADYTSWSADGKYLYYNNFFEYDRKEPAGFYRVSLGEGKIERLMDFPGFPLTGIFGAWSGITADGSVLVLQDKSTRDLYALDVDLP